MDGGEAGWDAALKIPASPFCRAAELEDILSVLGSKECRAVFLTSDRGLGASTVLRELVAQVGSSIPVVSLHGSMALSSVPFGVLTPFTAVGPKTHSSLKMGVLHALLAELERLRSQMPEFHAGDAALIVIDNAHFLDAETAGLLADLAMSGSVRIVAAHWSQRRLPASLAGLWQAGMAENIILAPLTLKQVQVFCQSALGGPLQKAGSRYLFNATGGNPLLLHLMLAEAAGTGQLRKAHGHWFLAHVAPDLGPALHEAVSLWLLGLSQEGLAAARLVALAEPVAEPVVRELFGAGAVAELHQWPLVRRLHGEQKQLLPITPIHGEVIRDLVPVGQSRALYQKFSQSHAAEPVDNATLLRRVSWALAVDVETPDELLLQAAIYAGRLHQSTTALHLADAVQDEGHRIKANVVKARAMYNLGDYQGALDQMGISSDEARTLEDLLFGSLLRTSIRSALGMPVQALEDDAEALRKGGERLSLEHPDQAGHILEHSRKSALLVTLMTLSREGRYSEMAPLAMVLARTNRRATAPESLYRTFAMAMDAERLTAHGYPLQATVRAEETFALRHSEGNDVFFLSEFIMLRHVAAALSAGEWDAVAAILDNFSQESATVVHSFSSTENVLQGMVLLRRGAESEALELLLTGVEALKISDPHQLLGFGTAMAAYAAATVGRRELAMQLLGGHVEDAAMFVVVAYERAYLAAAHHLLDPGGGGLAELLKQADAACADDSTMLELHALAMMLELGDEGEAGRVQDVAAEVEGPWARAVGAYARALQQGGPQALGDAAEILAGVGLHGLARQAQDKAAGRGPSEAVSGSAGPKQNRHQHLPGRVSGFATPAGLAGKVKLTRREHEVTRLAATGMSDREIAQILNVALRTVEGHLYRAYAKLAVSTREELPRALALLAREL